MVPTCCCRRYCGSMPHSLQLSPMPLLARLLCYALFESLARRIGEMSAGVSVHQRVRFAVVAPFQSAPEAGGLRVRRQQNIAGKSADGRETLLKVMEYVGIGCIVREQEG